MSESAYKNLGKQKQDLLQNSTFGRGRSSHALMNTPLMQKKAKEQTELFKNSPAQLKSDNKAKVAEMGIDVTYNSSEPAKVGAHAFAQGNSIHIASGQEKHLAHEVGHVIQQAEGRVKPTKVVNNVPINDNPSLEKEATVIGKKVLQQKTIDFNVSNNRETAVQKKPVLQKEGEDDDNFNSLKQAWYQNFSDAMMSLKGFTPNADEKKLTENNRVILNDFINKYAPQDRYFFTQMVKGVNVGMGNFTEATLPDFKLEQYTADIGKVQKGAMLNSEAFFNSAMGWYKQGNYVAMSMNFSGGVSSMGYEKLLRGYTFAKTPQGKIYFGVAASALGAYTYYSRQKEDS